MIHTRKDLKDSDLDIARLRREFDKIIVPSKAKELGVNDQDLVTTFRGGKRVFTTRARVAKDLQKQRKIAAPVNKEAERTQRAIRDGENSIVGDIEVRLTDCFRLARLLRRSSRMTPIEERDTKAGLRISADTALRFGTQLQGIEAEIERKKAADPLLSGLDNLARSVHAARERGDQEIAARLLNENRENLAHYESRRRALDPDIQSALHCRYGLLREQRRVMKTQLRLYMEWAQALRTRAQEVCAGHAIKNLKVKILASAKALEFESNTAECLQTERGGAEAPKEKGIRDRNRLEEEAAHRLRDSIHRISEHVTHLEKLLEQIDTPAQAGHGMVFRQKKD